MESGRTKNLREKEASSLKMESCFKANSLMEKQMAQEDISSLTATIIKERFLTTVPREKANTLDKNFNLKGPGKIQSLD